MANETEDSLSISQFQYLEAKLDQFDNSYKLLSTISSANFDGAIPDDFIEYPNATSYDIEPGRYILINDEFCLVTTIYENINSSTTNTESYEIFYVESDGVEQSKIILPGEDTFTDGTTLTVRKDDWDNKSVGNSGWSITTEGNSIFSNVAVRGIIEATDGYFAGNLTVGDPDDPDSPGSMRIGTNVDGTRENPGIQDGIYINQNNYWYDSGLFKIGNATKNVTWNNENLVVTGDINATGGTFSGKVGIGSMFIGVNASGTSNNGIHINGSNYWYDSGNFSLGTGTSTISFNGSNILFGTGIEISGSISANSLLLNNGAFSMSIQSNHNIVPSSERSVNQLVLSSSNPQLVLTTSTNHNFVEDDFIYLSGLSNSGGGLGALNKVFQILSTTPNTITIYSSQSTESIFVNADNSDTTLTVADSEGVFVGMTVSGTGIASNTTVTNVTDTVITISNATTQELSNVSITFATIPGTYDSSDAGWTNGMVQYSYDGIYVNQNNYWFSNGLFKIGNDTSSVSWNNSVLNVTGQINASSGNFTGYVTGGTSRFGAGVQAGKNGIWLNSTNYWYDDGTINADLGKIGGWSLSATELFSGAGATRVSLNSLTGVIAIGTGNHGALDTGFYVDKDGKFSLSNQLIFTPVVTAGRANISTTGTTSGTTITVASATGIGKGMTVTGTGIAPGTTVTNAVGTTITITPTVTTNQSTAIPISFILDDMSELSVTGRIKGVIESVTPITSPRLSTTITNANIVLSGTQIATFTTNGHAFLPNEKIYIEGFPATNGLNNLNNREYVISTVPDSITLTVSISGITGLTASTNGSLTATASLRELTMGLHPAEGVQGTDSWYHSAGTGIRLDKFNWWLTNNQFRVGTSGSYFEWDGTKFTIQGSGTKTLNFNVGSLDADNVISIADIDTTPTHNTTTTQFFVNGAGNFSLGQKLVWTASTSTLAIDGTVTIGGTAGSTVVSNASAGAEKPDVYRQTSAPTAPIKTGSIWYDTDDNNKTYVWDGSAWQITETNAAGVGLGNVSNLTPQNQTQTGLIAGTTITGGGITLSSGGNIKGGQTAFDTGTGFFLGYESEYKFSIGNNAGNKLTWNGNTLSIIGQVTATSGIIGGFTIGPSSLYGGSGSNFVGIIPASLPFFAGATANNGTGAKFSVTNAGALTATNADITGQIKATSGYIGGTTNGWIINPGNIQSSGGTAKITFDAINARLYIGTGTYANANTPFYTDGASRFSLGDKLTFTGGNLNITGAVTATSGSFTSFMTAGSVRFGVTSTNKNGIFIDSNNYFTTGNPTGKNLRVKGAEFVAGSELDFAQDGSNRTWFRFYEDAGNVGSNQWEARHGYTDNGNYSIQGTDYITPYTILQVRTFNYGGVLVRAVDNASTSETLTVVQAGSDYTPTGSYQFIQFFRENEAADTSTASGGIVSTSAGATPTFFSGSDVRLKNTIEEYNSINSFIEDMKNIDLYTWYSNEDTEKEYKNFGWLAKDWSENYPDLASGYENQIDEDGNPVYQLMYRENMIPYLYGVIKNLVLRVEELENLIN